MPVSKFLISNFFFFHFSFSFSFFFFAVKLAERNRAMLRRIRVGRENLKPKICYGIIIIHEANINFISNKKYKLYEKF